MSPPASPCCPRPYVGLTPSAFLTFGAGIAVSHHRLATVRQRTETAADVAREMAAAALTLGTRVPDVMLRDLYGQSVRLHDRIAGQLTLLVIVGARECLSCLNYL